MGNKYNHVMDVGFIILMKQDNQYSVHMTKSPEFIDNFLSKNDDCFYLLDSVLIRERCSRSKYTFVTTSPNNDVRKSIFHLPNRIIFG